MSRWRYDPELKEMVEISADWSDVESRAPVVTEGIAYANLRTTDGVDLSSRKRHRDYMKANGLALTGDYREAGPKAEAARLDRSGQRREIKEIVGRAHHQMQTQRNKR